jgi:hemoglobin
VTASHFARWKALFFETVDGLSSGAKAVEAKWRAEKMAEMFQMKIFYYNNQSKKARPLL